MNKSFIYGLVLLMIASMALAVSDISTACESINMNGIAKYDANTGIMTYASSTSHNIVVTPADKFTASWTSDPLYDVEGVIVNSVLATGQGANSGLVSGNGNAINDIVFCDGWAGGRLSFSPQGGDLIHAPEFSLFTLGIAVIGVGLGLAVLRKR
jgi:hypothetical protein